MPSLSQETLTLCTRCTMPLLAEARPCVACAEPAQEPSPCRHIGPYSVVELVGAGSVGRVYRCLEPGTETMLAVKLLQWPSNDALPERWLGDARAAARVEHPALAAIHSIGRARGKRFVAMEFIDGIPLHRLVAAKGKLGEQETLLILRALAQALQASHARGVIHRALRPTSVFIRRDGQVKLSDFGQVPPVSRGAAIEDPQRYLSPEQLMRETTDHRSDIHGLGMCAFYMLTGQTPPLLAENRMALPSLLDTVPELHAAMTPLVECMTLPDPRARPASCQDLLELIDATERSIAIASALRLGLEISSPEPSTAELDLSNVTVALSSGTCAGEIAASTAACEVA